mmetsp:Transcript_39857/g.98574  ORF Transcript_39857/g.98574 Transcript_39857/m.98574 type:complete len:562 (-) Transcript_39857:557-2242(-)
MERALPRAGLPKRARLVGGGRLCAHDPADWRSGDRRPHHPGDHNRSCAGHRSRAEHLQLHHQLGGDHGDHLLGRGEFLRRGLRHRGAAALCNRRAGVLHTLRLARAAAREPLDAPGVATLAHGAALRAHRLPRHAPHGGGAGGQRLGDQPVRECAWRLPDRRLLHRARRRPPRSSGRGAARARAARAARRGRLRARRRRAAAQGRQLPPLREPRLAHGAGPGARAQVGGARGDPRPECLPRRGRLERHRLARGPHPPVRHRGLLRHQRLLRVAQREARGARHLRAAQALHCGGRDLAAARRRLSRRAACGVRGLRRRAVRAAGARHLRRGWSRRGQGRLRRRRGEDARHRRTYPLVPRARLPQLDTHRDGRVRARRRDALPPLRGCGGRFERSALADAADAQAAQSPRHAGRARARRRRPATAAARALSAARDRALRAHRAAAAAHAQARLRAVARKRECAVGAPAARVEEPHLLGDHHQRQGARARRRQGAHRWRQGRDRRNPDRPWPRRCAARAERRDSATFGQEQQARRREPCARGQAARAPAAAAAGRHVWIRVGAR